MSPGLSQEPEEEPTAVTRLPDQEQLVRVPDRLWKLAGARNAVLASLDRNLIRFKRATDFSTRVNLADRTYRLARRLEEHLSSVFAVLFDDLNLPGDIPFTILDLVDSPDFYFGIINSTGVPLPHR